MRLHGSDEIDEQRGHGRIGQMVGEASVQLRVERDHRVAHALERLGHDQAAAAVAAVHHDGEALRARHAFDQHRAVGLEDGMLDGARRRRR